MKLNFEALIHRRPLFATIIHLQGREMDSLQGVCCENTGGNYTCLLCLKVSAEHFSGWAGTVGTAAVLALTLQCHLLAQIGL